MDIILKSKRHWLSIVTGLAMDAIIIGIFVAIYVYTPEITGETVHKITKKMTGMVLGSDTTDTIVLVKNGLLIFLFSWLILKVISGFIYNLTIEYTVYEDGVMIKKGFLPWKKFEYYFAPHQMHSATYSHNFLGWLFNLGTINIVGSEGVASTHTEYLMANARNLCSEINGVIDRYRQKKTND